METTSILLDDVEKSWVTLRGKVTALEKIDLNINKGEFFVLLGPSGCGKSTLLNLIAGLEKPSRGKIKFGEKTVACPQEHILLAPFERDIAMVFQSYALYPHMTIEKNLEFPLTNLKKKLPEADKKKMVMDAAKLLQIDKLLDRKPAELSGGQRQRVAIGRAIVRNPKIFLMDEPLSNLDAQLRMDMRAQLKALQQKLGVTTIYVTHDQLEAMTLGDRIAILNGGYIQQLGSPMDVFEKPVNVFVARFIGSPSMNMFTGELRTENGADVLHSPAITVKLPAQVASKMKARGGSKFTLGVRPEHFTLLPKGQGNLDVKIEVVEHIGTENLLYVFLANGTQIVVKTTDNPKDRELSLGLIPEKMHVFDEKEKRVE